MLYLSPIQSVNPHQVLSLVNSISDVTSKSGRLDHQTQIQTYNVSSLNNLIFAPAFLFFVLGVVELSHGTLMPDLFLKCFLFLSYHMFLLLMLFCVYSLLSDLMHLFEVHEIE